MNPRRLILGCVLALPLVLLGGNAGAVKNVVLTDDLRAHLLTLSPLIKTPVKARSLRDHVVVVSFFASWCPPCRAEFKTLNAIAGEFRDAPLTIIAINAYEDFDQNDEVRLERFLQDTSPRFKVVTGTDETLALFGGVDRIPTVFTFDADGKAVMRFVHVRDATKMSVDETELRGSILPALGELSRRVVE